MFVLHIVFKKNMASQTTRDHIVSFLPSLVSCIIEEIDLKADYMNDTDTILIVINAHLAACVHTRAV